VHVLCSGRSLCGSGSCRAVSQQTCISGQHPSVNEDVDTGASGNSRSYLDASAYDNLHVGASADVDANVYASAHDNSHIGASADVHLNADVNTDADEHTAAHKHA
jgi:hypothetical protein